MIFSETVHYLFVDNLMLLKTAEINNPEIMKISVGSFKTMHLTSIAVIN